MEARDIVLCFSLQPHALARVTEGQREVKLALQVI
jgi:hypothetical protein